MLDCATLFQLSDPKSHVKGPASEKSRRLLPQKDILKRKKKMSLKEEHVITVKYMLK